MPSPGDVTLWVAAAAIPAAILTKLVLEYSLRNRGSIGAVAADRPSTESDLRSRQGLRAQVLVGPKFVNVSTLSGRGVLTRDPLGLDMFLDPGASDAVLGAALLEALRKSRWPDSHEAATLVVNAKTRLREWEVAGRSRFGCRSARELYRGTVCCLASLVDGQLQLRFGRNSGTGSKWVMPTDPTCVLPAGAHEDELGRATRSGVSLARGE